MPRDISLRPWHLEHIIASIGHDLDETADAETPFRFSDEDRRRLVQARLDADTIAKLDAEASKAAFDEFWK